MAEKTAIEQLACFGSASPASERPLHVNRPNAGRRETFARLADSIWDSRWFTNAGPLVSRFEAALADRLQVPYCVVMSSGTAAMAAVVEALKLTGEVIVPSFTFISTAHVLQHAGITPVFCDIREDDWNIDPDAAAALVSPRSSAIIATHLWGKSADTAALQAIADRHGLALICDAAHAFGCTSGGRPIGGSGVAEVFSFQANKAFHAGEGGAVTTRDAGLARRLAQIRNFGFTDFDRVERLGTNAKLPELSAALGLTNLEAFDGHVARAREVVAAYRARLAGVPGLTLRRYGTGERSNYQYVVGLVDPDCPLPRDRIVEILHAENILVRRYFHPGAHRMEPYATLYPGAGAALPVTNDIANRVLILPGGAAITDDEIDLICNMLRLILNNAGTIADALREPAR